MGRVFDILPLRVKPKSLTLVSFAAAAAIGAFHLRAASPTSPGITAYGERDRRSVIKINFFSVTERRTPTPAGWEPYDGSRYTPERGHGWVETLPDFLASDGGPDGPIFLPGDVVTSSRALGRLELANWQATSQPAVFRIDLPNAWYRVHCASVAHSVLPVVDERTFKCRAHDAVFAGPSFGPPLKIRGKDLLEGSHIVEVTDHHLRIVVGDPAYGGWTWSYQGPWYQGWKIWWGRWGYHRYATGWVQKVTRVIDPGFHMLRINALEIRRVAAPAKRHALLFRDFFNRDDNADINSGADVESQWRQVRLDPAVLEPIESDLYKTSLRLTAPPKGKGLLGVLQKTISPEKGIIRYATRVSLYMGEGSKVRSGSQEAGLLILGESNVASEFGSTFVGVAFNRNRAGTPGSIVYRVGNGRGRYRTDSEIPDSALPFKITEGEYEIVVDHDVESGVLRRVQINDHDLTGFFPFNDRRQRISRGLFGIRAFMDALNSRVNLKQFYWYYRVEDIARTANGL